MLTPGPPAGCAGLLLAFTGLQNMGVVAFRESTYVGIGELSAL